MSSVLCGGGGRAPIAFRHYSGGCCAPRPPRVPRPCPPLTAKDAFDVARSADERRLRDVSALVVRACARRDEALVPSGLVYALSNPPSPEAIGPLCGEREELRTPVPGIGDTPGIGSLWISL